MTVQEKDIVADLEWRYATKKFDANRKIDANTWQKIEQSLILSPSSFGLQPWKFVVVTDQKKKEELARFSWAQNQPADCSHLVVICRVSNVDSAYIDHYLNTIAKVRGIEANSLSAYKDMMVNSILKMDTGTQAAWTSAQCYIALGVLMSAAAALQVDSCPMEGFIKEDYDRILDLNSKGLHSVVVCPLGYRANDDKYASLKKVRFPASEVILHI